MAVPCEEMNGAAVPTRLALPERLRQTERALIGTFLYLPEPEVVRVPRRVRHTETRSAYYRRSLTSI